MVRQDVATVSSKVNSLGDDMYELATDVASMMEKMTDESRASRDEILRAFRTGQTISLEKLENIIKAQDNNTHTAAEIKVRSPL